MKGILICMLIIFYNLHAFSQQIIYNIFDYGAVNDSSINSRSAIQQAIDDCAKEGGGVVDIPAGSFASNTIYLASNVTLHLEEGAKLYAIPDSSLYTNSKAGIENTGASFTPALVVANGVKHIAITGSGSIIGLPQFYEFPVTGDDEFPGWNANARQSGVKMIAVGVKQPKISLVYLSDCEDVQLKDIHIINSPNWSCHIQWSSNVLVQHITIHSSLEKGVNSDGLDIDGCNNVRITDCNIATGDDAICLKTTRQNGRTEKCENITVSQCHVSSSSCALKLGTESYGDFNHIVFAHCIVTNSNRGLGIFIRDGAQVRDVLFADISIHCTRKPFFWWGDGDAFQFVILKRNAQSKEGSIQQLTLKNITAETEGGSLIKGLHINSIQHVLLSHISIIQHAESQPDKRAVNIMNIQQAQDVTLNEIRLLRDTVNTEPKWSSALSVSAVEGFSLKNFTSNQQQVNKQLPAISKTHVTNAKQDHQ